MAFEIMLWVFLAGATFLLSSLAVGQFTRWATSRQMLDIPNDRSSHTRPTPRGGGLAIVFVVLVSINASWPLIAPLIQTKYSSIGLFTFGAAVIAFVSWLDDLRSVPNRIRFVVHLLGALLVVIGFGYWAEVVIPPNLAVVLGVAGLPFTLLWIVGLVNFFNFMDGIDGIVGGQSLVAGVAWISLGWLSDSVEVTVLGVLVAAGSAGFLMHNWSPARIFMGDVGSTFLGYSFAALPIMTASDDIRVSMAGVIFIWPFIFDTVYTILRRLFRGERIFQAHRSHLYQRLVIAGRSHRFVSSLYMGLAASGSIVAIIWTRQVPYAGLLLCGLIPLSALGLWRFVVLTEARASQGLSNADPLL